MSFNKSKVYPLKPCYQVQVNEIVYNCMNNNFISKSLLLVYTTSHFYLNH